jgi:NAD-dependent dihydropyrimidine dehydrogenase PreA subunit
MAYVIDQDKCQKDDNCVEACPVAAIEKKEDGSLFIKEDECNDCGACEQVCEYDAIHPPA